MISRSDAGSGPTNLAYPSNVSERPKSTAPASPIIAAFHAAPSTQAAARQIMAKMTIP